MNEYYSCVWKKVSSDGSSPVTNAIYLGHPLVFLRYIQYQVTPYTGLIWTTYSEYHYYIITSNTTDTYFVLLDQEDLILMGCSTRVYRSFQNIRNKNLSNNRTSIPFWLHVKNNIILLVQHCNHHIIIAFCKSFSLYIYGLLISLSSIGSDSLLFFFFFLQQIKNHHVFSMLYYCIDIRSDCC